MGNGTRQGAWGGGVRGLDSRRESRSVGGEEPARKHIFVEDDMARDDDAVGDEVKVVIPLMVRGVAEEDATGGAGG
jgi:hypothetical protein